MEEIKLTAYSHGAGCGCKISPSLLEEILKSNKVNGKDFSNTLLVGNQGMDDAAVTDIGDGRAIISTTDFFMPIVDESRNVLNVLVTFKTIANDVCLVGNFTFGL